MLPVPQARADDALSREALIGKWAGRFVKGTVEENVSFEFTVDGRAIVTDEDSAPVHSRYSVVGSTILIPTPKSPGYAMCFYDTTIAAGRLVAKFGFKEGTEEGCTDSGGMRLELGRK